MNYCSVWCMAGRGRPKLPLVLTDEERATLVRWSRRAKSSQALALRCRIELPLGAPDVSNLQIAKDLGVHPDPVSSRRGSCGKERLDGGADEKRPGRPSSV